MPAKLREMFEDKRYWERAEAGEFRQEIIANNHPSRNKANEPYCTRSQLIAYIDRAGREVARVHQYLKPDGTLGASGKPDPKSVLFSLKLYISLL